MLQKGIMAVLSPATEAYAAHSTPRQSLLPSQPPLLPKDELLDISETEKIKSLRVMEWVREDNQNHLPPHLTERLSNSPLGLGAQGYASPCM